MVIHLIVRLMIMIQYNKKSTFSKPQSHIGGNVKVEFSLPNCAINSDVKNATGIDTSTFAE